MGARQKLNVAYFNGAIIFAIAVGVGSSSWLIGLIAFAVLVAAGVYSRDIRLG